MATFAITVRSIYYEYYEVKADTEEQAMEVILGCEDIDAHTAYEWKEDTELYNIDDVTDIYEGEK